MGSLGEYSDAFCNYWSCEEGRSSRGDLTEKVTLTDLAPFCCRRAKGLVRYEASPAQKDLVKSYIFVLALHVNDFKLEVLPLTNLRQEMGMAVQATIKLLMQLGCAVVQMQSDRFNKGYSAQLLRSVSDPPKTLRECFPNLDHNEYKRSR